MSSWKLVHGQLLAGVAVLGLVWAGLALRAEPVSHANTVAPSHAAHSLGMGPVDEFFDLRFIDAMILHHEGALAMAEEALEKSQRPEVRQLAEAILAAQSSEIEQMRAWRQIWYPEAPLEPLMWHAEGGHMMAMSPEVISNMRMDRDLGSPDDGFDLRFLEAMILHHEGALSMAEEALRKSRRPEILELAKAILATQQAEIEQMRAWQRQWYPQ